MGTLSFAALVQTTGEVAIVPRVSARVDQLNVDVGSRVRLGDVLFELDHSGLDQQVLAAQAAQASAEARLAALRAGPKQEVLAAAQANLRAAQARVGALQSQRDNADIAALDQRVRDAQAAVDRATNALQPDAQAVAQADAAANAAKAKLSQLQADPTKAKVGSNVSPSAPILTLIPPDMQVVVQADETQLAQLQVGQSANLSVESFPKEAFTETVKGIAPVLDPRTRSVAVQIDVPDPQSKLKPGMFAQLAIQTGQRAAALMVPKEAVLRVGSVDPTAPVQSVVYTVAESRVHKQVVSVGASDGKNVEITQGLQEGIDLVLNPRPDFLEGELISNQ